jgi:hypothetical protein
MIMVNRNRREFLADVGRGMLVASVGPALATDLGLSPLWAGDVAPSLSFGDREPLVELLQQTPADKLLPILAQKLKAGVGLDTLVAAAALANARTFGGQDYTGYHAFMALMPAYQMTGELPAARRALPVFKVLYRNTQRMQDVGGRKNEILHPVVEGSLPSGRAAGEVLREATRAADMDGAEHVFAALSHGPVGEAFNHLQFAIQDELNVHRVVLAWRAWAVLDVVGKEQAHSLLRQSVRFCVDEEKQDRRLGRGQPEIRKVLPKLLDQYRLVGRPIGKREADDGWVEHLAQAIYAGSGTQAAEAAAAALAEGMSPEVVGEAISLAANRLVLCDRGRIREEPEKPVGSVHGASVGVHASDSANAWRNIAHVTDTRNTVASLIVGACHTGGQSKPNQDSRPRPLPEDLEKVKTTDPGTLLRNVESAVKSNDQGRACALVHHYGELGHPPRPVFDLLLRYAVSEDGALHAEKYYRTVTEEFAATRPAFRWRHLVALARVTASEYGYAAPGYVQACELLKV